MTTSVENKITVHADITMSEETFKEVLNQQHSRGHPNIDRTLSVLVAESVGKPGGPAWSPTSVSSLPDGQKKVLKALADAADGLTPSQLADQAGTGAGTKAYLAHLTIHYRAGMEQLHLWDESAQKYMINAKYRQMIQALVP